jgi:hypothetical protein
MTAAKTMALVALALALATSRASADGIGTTFQWNSWNSQGNVVSAGFTEGASTPAPPAFTVTSSNLATTTPSFSTNTPAYSTTPPGSSSTTYDAFINMTSGNFMEAAGLTTGNPQPWYDSAQVAKVFGGTPNSQQQAAFTSEVLTDVQRVYANSGIPVTLTTNPSAPSAHMISVVSNTSTPSNAQAIGITDIGANGFDFIDKLTNFNTPDQLAQAVANNVAHELMHAFGVAVHYDQTGTHIDSAIASTALLTNPNATFSPQATQALLGLNFQNSTYNSLTGFQSSTPRQIDGDEVIAPQPIPEPATLALWGAALSGLALNRIRRSKTLA